MTSEAHDAETDEDDWNLASADVHADLNAPAPAAAAAPAAPPQPAAPAPAPAAPAPKRAVLKRPAANRAQSQKQFEQVLSVMDRVFGTCHVQTRTALGFQLEMGHSDVRRRLSAAAYSAFTVYRSMTSTLVKAVMGLRGTHERDGRLLHVRPQHFWRFMVFDEAQADLEVEIPDGNAKYSGLDGPCDLVANKKQKVLVTEAFVVATARADDPTGNTGWMSIDATVATHPQAIESTDGETLTYAHKCLLDNDWDALVASNFPRQIDFRINDEHKANLRAQRYHEMQHPERAHYVAICDAHKKATAIGDTTEVVPDIISRTIRLQLSLHGPVRQHLKHKLRILQKERFCINYGKVSAAANQHRQRTMDLWFHGKNSAADIRRRALIERLYNGDVARLDIVEHVEDGCCTSPEETLRLMLSEGTDAMVPDLGFRTLDRQNFTDATGSVQAIGLPGGIHGLFQCAYPLAMEDAKRSAQPKAKPKAKAVPAPVPPPIADAPPDDAQPQNIDEMDGIYRLYHEDPNVRNDLSTKWVVQGDMYQEISMVTVFLNDMYRYVLNEMKRSSARWERRQQVKESKGEAREYPLIIAAKGEEDDMQLQVLKQFVFDPAPWRVLGPSTEFRQLQCFKCGSRAGAATDTLVARRHKTWEYQVWRIFDEPDVMDKYIDESDCLLGIYSDNFRRFYGDGLRAYYNHLARD